MMIDDPYQYACRKCGYQREGALSSPDMSWSCPKCGHPHAVTEIKYSVSIKQCIVMPVQAYVGDKVIAAIELHVSPHMQGRNQAVEGIIKPKKLWMGEIYRMWTAPDYRRQGIMTKLLQICKEGAAIPDGGIMHRLITSVEDSTEQGKAFLRHHGFGYSRSGLEWVRGSDKL